MINNLAEVVLVLARQPNIRMRELALQIGISDQTVQKIINELRKAGYLSSTKSGRRNWYLLHLERPLQPIAGLQFSMAQFIGFYCTTPREELSAYQGLT